MNDKNSETPNRTLSQIYNNLKHLILNKRRSIKVKDMKNIDLLKDERLHDFENIGFILITGITEATLNDAITLAEATQKSDILTA